MKRLLNRINRVALLAAVTSAFTATAVAAEFDAALVEAAEKEGQLVVYTANQLESEQDLVAQFNKKFPNINVEIVRAPGGRLATRIQTEVAAGKLSADVIDMSDRGLVESFQQVFADYAPPNAAQYPDALKDIPNVWPKTVWGFVLAYNAASGVEPPASWADLTKEKYRGKVGVVVANSGGSTWTRALFERKVVSDDYWKSLAANDPVLYPSGAPTASGIVRGEALLGGVQSNSVIPMVRDGAPIKVVYPKEGVPVTASVAGIVEGSKNPNAARLFMDWALSADGQSAWVENGGGFSVMEGAPLPEGADPSTRLWIPDSKEFTSLRNEWLDQWNKVFGVH